MDASDSTLVRRATPAVIDGLRIRRLVPSDVDGYVALRLEMLLDTPVAFLGRPDDDSCLDIDIMEERLGEGDDAIFAAEDGDGQLLSVAGLYRQRHAKTRHSAMIWGVYTTPRARKLGLSERVLAAAIDYAARLDGLEVLRLAVSVETPNAQRLYERLGFEAWGREPLAVKDGDRHVDEVHMWRAVRG